MRQIAGRGNNFCFDASWRNALRYCDLQAFSVSSCDGIQTMALRSSRRRAPKHWPTYDIGRHDYVHTLGALAANFNYLESWLKYLFTIYVTLPPAARGFLFAKLDNAARLELLKHCFENSPHPERFKKALRHFVKGFAACAENRNVLLHAQAVAVTLAGTKAERTLFFKSSRKPPFRDNAYLPSIAQLRAIADSTHSFAVYGRILGRFIEQTYDSRPVPAGATRILFPWPRKPLLPKLLAPEPSEALRIPAKRRHPPRPSDA
jgi:hypothetical protein